MKKTKDGDTGITLKDVFSLEGLKVAGLAAIPAASLSLLAYTSFYYMRGQVELDAAVKQACESTQQRQREQGAAVIKDCSRPEQTSLPLYVYF